MTSPVNEVQQDAEDQSVPPGGSSQQNVKSRLIVVEPVLTLFFAVLIPSGPLIQQFIYSEVAALKNFVITDKNDEDGICGSSNSMNDSNYLLQQEVQATTARWMVYLDFMEIIPSLLSTIFLGSLSDVMGRKIAIMLPIVGQSVKFLLYICVIAWQLPIYVLLIAEFVHAMFGGPMTIVVACFAYIADVYEGRMRTFRITILDVIFGLVGSIANIGMGYYIQNHGFYYPFFLLIGLNLINLVYTVVGIPEIREFKPGIKLLTFEHLTKSFQVIYKPSVSKWKIIIFVFAFNVSGTLLSSRRNLETLFVLNSPLCWSSVLIGYYNAYSSVVLNTGNFVFTFLLLQYLGEVGLVILGCVSGALGLLWFSVSVKTWMIFLSNFFYILYTNKHPLWL